MMKRVIAMFLAGVMLTTSVQVPVRADEVIEDIEDNASDEEIEEIDEKESDSESDSNEINENQDEEETALNADGDIASGHIDNDKGGIDWKIDANGRLSIVGKGDCEKRVYGMPPWCEYAYAIKTAYINLSESTDLSYYFTCGNLETIDLSDLDTSEVADMRHMFQGCGKLTTLDLSGFDTSKVTDMSGMFVGCDKLTTLDLSGFDTSKVVDMSDMFSCYNLSNLNIDNFDTSSVTNMSNMFEGCYKLKNLDLDNFDTSSVTNMSGMFAHFANTGSLNINNFDTSKVTDMSHMFEYCFGLEDQNIYLDISNFDTSKVTDMSCMFQDCHMLPRGISNFDTSNVTDMSHMFESVPNETLDLRNFNTSKVTNMSHMFDFCYELTSLDLRNFDTYRVTDMSYMFKDCHSLKMINLSSFNTENVTTMEAMFSQGDYHGYGVGLIGSTMYDTEIRALDLSGFNTSKVEDMSGMFDGLYNLERLDISNFDTSNVTGMRDMFDGCSSLTSLDLSNFDTSKVTDMSGMFDDCSSLTFLDLRHFDTSKVTDMSGMFNECRSLKSLDLRHFDTSKVTDMSGMFEGCDFKKIDISSIKTSNVTDMSYMFVECKNLSTIIRRLDTSKVTDMSYMFEGCSSLTSLDLGNFDTSNVTDMSGMFEGCSSLTSLDLSNFDTSNVTDLEEMLCDCDNLNTVNLSSFDCSNLEEYDNDDYDIIFPGYYPMFYGAFDAGSTLSLTKINAPTNIPANIKILLPSGPNDAWYLSDGSTTDILPQESEYSRVIQKNEIPDASEDGKVKDTPIVDLKVDASKSAIVVMDGDTKEYLPNINVVITVKGKDYPAKTDSKGMIYTNYEGDAEIAIAADNYSSICATKKLSFGKAAVIKIYKTNKTLTLISATAQISDMLKDVTNQTIYIVNGEYSNTYKSHTNEDVINYDEGDIPLKINVTASPDVKEYQLVQVGKVLQQNKNGSFVFDVKSNIHGVIFSNEFEAGYPVYLRLIDGLGKKKTIRLGINVSSKSSFKAKWNAKTDSKVSFAEGTVEVPNSIPLIGGSTIDTGFTGIPVEIAFTEDGKLKVALNLGATNSWDGKKEAFDKYCENYENAKKAGENSYTKIGNFSWKTSFVGYGEGYVDDEADSVCVNVNVVVKASGSAKTTKYFYYVIPMYISFGGGLDLSAGGETQLVFKDNKLNLEGYSIELNVDPYLTVAGGVGADGIISVGAYGKGQLKNKVRYSDDLYYKMSLNGTIDIKATALLWSKTICSAEGDWVLVEKQTKLNRNAAANSIGKAVDMSGAKLISTKYLDINANAGESLLGASASNDLSDEYVFDNASPKLISTDDGLYIVYINGVKGREAQNQTAVFYRKSNDGGKTWSAETRVDNMLNETADDAFDVIYKDHSLYIIWSDSSKEFDASITGMDSSKAIDTMLKSMDITVSKIDTKNGGIEVFETGTALADTKPQLVAFDNKIYAMWIANDISSEAGFASSKNNFSICYSTSADKFESVKIIALDKNNYPLASDAGILGENAFLALGLDTDGNENTENDREIALFNPCDDSLSFLTKNSEVDSGAIFAKVNNKNQLLWYSNGIIKCIDSIAGYNKLNFNDVSKVPGQEFNVIEGVNSVLTWTESDADTNRINIYAAPLDDLNDVSSYKLGEIESCFTTNPSGTFVAGEPIYVYAGTAEDGYTRLHLDKPEKSVDTKVSFSLADETIPGKNYNMSFLIKNEGNSVINKINIKTAKGKSETKLVSIAPGKTANIEWDSIVLPANMTSGYMDEVKVYAEGEANQIDNVCSLDIGNTDLVIDTDLEFSGEDYYANVLIDNNGFVPTDALLKVYTDEELKHKVGLYELNDLNHNDPRLNVVNLTQFIGNSQVFYFTIVDKNGKEINLKNNTSVVYVGEGAYAEMDKIDRDSYEEYDGDDEEAEKYIDKIIKSDDCSYVLNLATKEKLTIPELAKTKSDGKNYKIKYDKVGKKSDSQYAAMTSKGLITAKKAGVSHITLNKNGVEYKITVNVFNPQFKYENPKKKYFTVNTGSTVTPAYEDCKLKPTFTLDKNAIKKGLATINPETGEVTPLKKGNVKVIATVGGGENPKYARKVTTTVKIYDPVIYTGKKSEVKVNKVLKASVKNGVKGTSDWKSSDEAIATVDKNGRIRGIAPGVVTISCTNNGKPISKEITVIENPRLK